MYDLKTICYYSALLGFPLITWYKLFRFIKKQNKENIVEKHTSLVHYIPNEGIKGWPTIRKTNETSVFELYETLTEPIVCFIKTAQKSLDIAVMSINIPSVYTVLNEKLKEGVEVRIIVDFEYSKQNLDLYKLEKNGAKVKYHVRGKIDSMMHYKFAVKDFDGRLGYLLVGSMNWTLSSLHKNYDDLVFLDNFEVVRKFHDNFQTSWQYITSSYSLPHVTACLNRFHAQMKLL